MTKLSSSSASGVTHAAIDVAKDFPRNGPERLVLPGLDVARTPVVYEHDPEHVVAERGSRHGLPQATRSPDDEAELELEVEAAARPERRRLGVRRLGLPARPDDRRAGHDERARAPVIPDRDVSPVREQRLAVGTEQPPQVGRVLERRVEVDVVAGLDREMHRRGVDGYAVGTRLDELVDACCHVLPDGSAQREERVQRRRPEGRAEAGGGEIDHLVPDTEADAWLASSM